MQDYTAAIAAAVALCAIAACICAKANTISIKKKPSSSLMPGFKLIYADKKNEGENSSIPFGTLLSSPEHKLQGKPDYIFKNALTGGLIPLELKSGKIGTHKSPHTGDMLQLIAYFLIIESVYGKRPKYGKLVYRDYMFVIKNNAAARRMAIKRLGEMRAMLKTGIGKPSSSYAACRPCLCRQTVCEHCRH